MEQQRPYWKVVVSLIFSLIATAAFIIIGLRAIGFFVPFVIGWIISSIAAPVVNWLEKKLNIVKKLGTVLIVILVIGLIIFICYLLIDRIVVEGGRFINDIPQLYGQLEEGFAKIGATLSGLYVRLPQEIQNGWNTMIQNLNNYVGEIISKISQPTVTAAGNIAKSLPSILVSTIVAILSAYFFTVEREEVISWLKKVAPPSISRRMTLVMDNLHYAVGGYLKAQFKIMCVVFLILLAGFAMMGVSYYVLVAALIAFLDFLPFFGTGTAMIPWALYKLLTGSYQTTVLLLVVYAVTQVVRQLLQPKLVADSMGLNPLLTLFLLYTGYRIRGVFGMILAVPIGLVVINMYQAGAFDYIFDDVKILVNGILKLRKDDEE